MSSGAFLPHPISFESKKDCPQQLQYGLVSRLTADFKKVEEAYISKRLHSSLSNVALIKSLFDQNKSDIINFTKE